MAKGNQLTPLPFNGLKVRAQTGQTDRRDWTYYNTAFAAGIVIWDLIYDLDQNDLRFCDVI